MREIGRVQESPIILNEFTIPIKNPEVTIREEIEEDGKYILFNAENELILVMNPTGKFIFENCNGKKSIRDIAEEIDKFYAVKENTDLNQIVKNYISTLLLAKLVKIEGVN